MKDHVESFSRWTEELRKGKLQEFNGRKQVWQWLEHVPRVLLSFPEYSTSKILEKYASWNKQKNPKVEMKELIPVIIYHSTIGIPLGAAKNAEEVLDTFVGVLRQLETLNNQDFVHRDVSYANIFMRQLIPGQEDETAPTVGWLNDFDFSINLARTPARSPEGGDNRENNEHAQISGTFPFLSRRALQAVLNQEDSTVPPYRQTIMDDVESTLFCLYSFFTDFVPQEAGETGPFYLRSWSGKNDTSMGQASGKLWGDTDPTSVLGVKPLLLEGRSPLSPWFGETDRALNSKLLLLRSGQVKATFDRNASRLLDTKDESWKWDQEKVLSLLWDVSKPLLLSIEDVENFTPTFPGGANQKIEVSKVVNRMVKALEDGKESLKKR
ncbi:hypothetical protein BT69DRAFT_859631 [Atractiella rhizophila]|nr:hypothetical protein BT69DRAFT_859631 [Atractiella rhizophila]